MILNKNSGLKTFLLRLGFQNIIFKAFFWGEGGCLKSQFCFSLLRNVLRNVNLHITQQVQNYFNLTVGVRLFILFNEHLDSLKYVSIINIIFFFAFLIIHYLSSAYHT